MFQDQLRNLLWIAVTVAGLSLSCQSEVGEEKRAYEERLRSARAHLHQGDLEASKKVLTQLQSEYPYREDVKVTLASVYIAEANLSIDQFYPFAETLIDVLDEQKSLWSEPWWLTTTLKESKAKRAQGSVKFHLYQWLRMSSRLTNFFYLFEQLPVIDPDERFAVQEALVLLDEVSTHKKGVALYRSVLRAVLLKAELNDPLELIRWMEDCELQVKEVFQRVGHVWSLTRLIFLDLQQSFPRKHAELKEWQKEGDEVMAWLNEQAGLNPYERFSRLVVEAGIREIRLQESCE